MSFGGTVFGQAALIDKHWLRGIELVIKVEFVFRFYMVLLLLASWEVTLVSVLGIEDIGVVVLALVCPGVEV